ncbi:MAG: IclR family transcriptional regulator [Aliiglaciecola sp.]|uniref:IclR family transcriptional regulator n=1 Tax=Aliiglaciecola sp. TaxID=1872441 RepID=UPI003298AF07
MKECDSSSTVDKAIRILIELAKENQEVGTTSLGRKLDIHKATVSRLLMKLAEHEFVYKNKETGKYWLGPAIYQLAMTMADVNFDEILHLARPHIDELRDGLQETVTLEIWLGNSTVPTYTAPSNLPLKVVLPPGEVLPLHTAAGAKAILSYIHDERVDMLLKGELEKVTPNTITDKQQLRERLIEYNKQGYATDKEELHLGICAVAVPIFNSIRQPIAAIVVLTPSSRFGQKLEPSLISKLKKKATVIGTEMMKRGIRY